ncbi:hypothetical protein GCK32_000398 [Trichostrongylus colubriformis]|uniref:Matrix-remodeling-associated protein 7 helical domain-containing protein n=1 Tax=Trichostrongylus colubriformis TaxID=6319 RepID=A0AAN8IIH7_TRICO
MLVHENFWKQLAEYIETYGLTMIAVTVASCLLIGYVAHYIVNILPMRQRLLYEKLQKEEEEEELQESTNARSTSSGQKQVGIVKGMINTELVASLRKPLDDSSRNKSSDPVSGSGLAANSALVKQSSSTSDEEEEEVDDDDDDSLMVTQGNEKRMSASLQEGSLKSERDLLDRLGNLHGKLATAQLRARTRKMQADMTDEERNDEARAKAKQLESIMKLMMQNQEKFGMSSEEDIKEQLNMYNF